MDDGCMHGNEHGHGLLVGDIGWGSVSVAEVENTRTCFLCTTTITTTTTTAFTWTPGTELIKLTPFADPTTGRLSHHLHSRCRRRRLSLAARLFRDAPVVWRAVYPLMHLFSP